MIFKSGEKIAILRAKGQDEYRPLTDEQVIEIYNRIYNMADKLFKKHNPCRISKRNGEVFCKLRSAAWRTCVLSAKRRNMLCCEQCFLKVNGKSVFNKNRGCTIKALGCKIYVCSAITEKHRWFADLMSRLSNIMNTASHSSLRHFQDSTEFLKERHNNLPVLRVFETEQNYNAVRV